VLVFLLWPTMVSADSVQIGQVTLEGIVPPMRCLIVNNQNQIVEVVSNTNAEIQPTVLRNKVLDSNQISITPLIQWEYNVLGRHLNLNQVGMVYKLGQYSPKVKKSIPLILTVLTWHNYDYLMSSIFKDDLKPLLNL
jgi:hypothetical protein